VVGDGKVAGRALTASCPIRSKRRQGSKRPRHGCATLLCGWKGNTRREGGKKFKRHKQAAPSGKKKKKQKVKCRPVQTTEGKKGAPGGGPRKTKK